MDSKQMVHMNQGETETSYARNSSFQSAEQNRMKTLMEAAIVDICSNTSTLSCRKMVIADLGCSSGPNAVALVSIALEATRNHFLQLRQTPPEVNLLLNDLPYNDFNIVVKSLVALRQINEPVVVAGVVPGSFYERLFPSGSVHLFCSSNSLHWLSKGMIDKAKFDSLYIPVYGPSLKELSEIIQEEGSFSITEMRVHEPAGGMDSALLTPNRIASCMRAAFEPIVVQHFGSSGEVMDEFVRTAEKHLSLQGSSQVKQTENPIVMLVVSLSKASDFNCEAFSASLAAEALAHGD